MSDSPSKTQGVGAEKENTIQEFVYFMDKESEIGIYTPDREKEMLSKIYDTAFDAGRERALREAEDALLREFREVDDMGRGEVLFESKIMTVFERLGRGEQ